MLPTLLYVLILTLPAPGMVSATLAECAALDQPARVGICTTELVDTPKDRPGARFVRVEEDEDTAEGPQVWIGVRLTAVPAPLAAHLGDRGIMIANVVKGSPADQAGVQQYDVVVAFAGKEVNRPQDLTEAVADVAAGSAVQLEVLRKAQPRALQITPVQRPADGAGEMKYEEPQSAWLDEGVNLRGLTLKQGPGGEWTMRDLGPLKGWSDALGGLKDLQDFDIHMNVPGVHGADDGLRALRKLDEAFRWHTDDADKPRVEVKIRVDDDGRCTTIQRDADGRIHVTHEEPNGKQSTATYEDAEVFAQADPESYDVYQRHGEDRTPTFKLRLNHRSPNAARELREEYQVDVERQLKDALDKASKTRAKAETRAKEAYRETVKQSDRPRGRTRTEPAEKPAASAEAIAVRVHDDGRITATVTKDGNEVTYEFKNRPQFKASQPELYERVKGLLN